MRGVNFIMFRVFNGDGNKLCHKLCHLREKTNIFTAYCRLDGGKISLSVVISRKVIVANLGIFP